MVMLFTAKTLKRYRLESFDGDIGCVKEFYFRRVLDRSPSGRSHRLLAQ
jgi:hypothetical protein